MIIITGLTSHQEKSYFDIFQKEMRINFSTAHILIYCCRLCCCGHPTTAKTGFFLFCTNMYILSKIHGFHAQAFPTWGEKSFEKLLVQMLE